MTKKQTLLIIYNNMNLGGIQIKIIDIINQIHKNHKNTNLILCLRKKEGIFLKKISLKTKIISPNINRSSWQLILFPFWITYQIIKYKPRIILTFMDYAAISTLIAKKICFWTKTKIIINEEITTSIHTKTQKFPFLRFFLIRLLYPATHRILVPTITQKKDLIKLTNIKPSKIIITPNWLPQIVLQKKTKKRTKTTDILFMGRLEYQKNPTRLIKIIKLVKKEKPDIKTKIVGSGSLRKKIKKLISKNNLQKNIKLYSSTKIPEIFYNQSKILLLPSRYEGFPFSLLEALFANCLPIVSNIQEFKSFFTKYKKNLIFKTNKQAGKQIIHLLKHKKTRKQITKYYHNKVKKEQKPNIKKTIKLIVN